MAKSKQPVWWEVFVTEYLRNGQDAKAAYLVAKPRVKPGTAKVEACKLLTKPNFQAFLATRRDRLVERQEMTREKWLGMLCDIAGFDVREYLKLEANGDVKLVADWKDRLDGHVIEEVILSTTKLKSGLVVQDVKLKRDSKLKALEMIGKAMGWLKDRVELEGGVDLATRISDARQREAKDEVSRG